MEIEILQKFQALENRHKKLKQYFIGVVTLMLIGVFSIRFTKDERFGVIRARGGIIIEDASVKDGILLCTSVPYSKNRVRTGSSMIRNAPAKLVIFNRNIMSTITM